MFKTLAIARHIACVTIIKIETVGATHRYKIANVPIFPFGYFIHDDAKPLAELVDIAENRVLVANVRTDNKHVFGADRFINVT